jgi:hypothetical protein
LKRRRRRRLRKCRRSGRGEGGAEEKIRLHHLQGSLIKRWRKTR